MKTKKTSFNIDEAVWKEVKVFCASTGEDMQDFVNEALKDELKKRKH